MIRLVIDATKHKAQDERGPHRARVHGPALRGLPPQEPREAARSRAVALWRFVVSGDCDKKERHICIYI